MPNINPFPVSTFQSVLDSFIQAMKGIRTPAVLGKIIPFIIVVGVVGVIVFGFLGLGFRVFAQISERTFRRSAENVDDFVSGKRKKDNSKKFDLGDKSKIKTKKFDLET